MLSCPRNKIVFNVIHNTGKLEGPLTPAKKLYFPCPDNETLSSVAEMTVAVEFGLIYNIDFYLKLPFLPIAISQSTEQLTKRPSSNIKHVILQQA